MVEILYRTFSAQWAATYNIISSIYAKDLFGTGNHLLAVSIFEESHLQADAPWRDFSLPLNQINIKGFSLKLDLALSHLISSQKAYRSLPTCGHRFSKYFFVKI